jgi:hypothetical protein
MPSPADMQAEDASVAAALERIAARLDALEGTRQWPALMRPSTLRAYLDCRSDSDFARRMRTLKKRGYPGPDPATHRHVKDVVDRYLVPVTTAREEARRRILRAARDNSL